MYKPTGRALEYVTVIMCGSAQLLFGYDQGVLSGFVGTEEWRKVMGYPDTNLTGTITALYNIGCLFGAISASIIGDRLGRKNTIVLGSFIVCIGAILQASAFSVPQMIVGRLVTGFGTGHNTTTVPILQSELSKPHRRGILVIAETSITIFGIALANWVDYGLIYGLPGVNQWRIGLALQGAFPLIVFALIGFVPESPRWLASQGRYDEARESVTQIQGGDPVVEAQAIDKQVAEIIITAEHESAVAAGWREIFKSGELQNGRRVLLGGFSQFMQQFGGINLLAYYAPIIFETSLGLNTKLSQILSGVGATCFWLGSMVPIPIIETVGRRGIMMAGGVSCGLFMVTLAISTSIIEKNPGTTTATNAGWSAVAFIFLYYFSFGATWNGVPWLYAPEINSLRTRNKGAAFSTSMNWLWNFVIVEVTPTGIATIGYKFYIIWALFNAVFVPIVYFFYPETAGRSLEEMDEMFKRNPGWIVRGEFRKRGVFAAIKTHDAETPDVFMEKDEAVGGGKPRMIEDTDDSSE